MCKTNKKSYLEIGKNVIALEIEALHSLLTVLDSSFENSVNEILKVKGHVIITGIGKSGIIGRKIAATFAATGTPAFFIHPTDASHGDLGAISSNSLLLIISKSGNTTELNEIIRYAEIQKVPIISITSNIESFVFKKSKICLYIPSFPEACSISFTPTTSSMMSLAIGDALAIAILNARNLKKNQIAKRHPCGALGRQLTD